MTKCFDRKMSFPVCIIYIKKAEIDKAIKNRHLELNLY